jgi:hypothetical protein
MSEKKSLEELNGFRKDKEISKGKRIKWKTLLSELKKIAKQKKNKIITFNEFMDTLEKYCNVPKTRWTWKLNETVKIPTNKFNILYWLRYYSDIYEYELYRNENGEVALKFK